MIEGTCHCGAVGYEFRDTPEAATRCNCSLCRRLGTLWIYTAPENVTVREAQGATVGYRTASGRLEFRSCTTCGTTVYWRGVAPDYPRMAVNLSLAELDVIDGIRIRRFDGADTWTFLD
ncbi:MAG: GFA family protein [Pseudomonadota bacterium]